MTNIQNAASALTHRTGERTGTSVTGNNVQLLHYGGSGTIIKGYKPALGCLAPIGSLERPTDKTGQLLVQSHDQRGVSIVYTGAAADGPRVEMSRVCFLYAAETQRRSTPAKKQKWLPLFVQSHATELLDSGLVVRRVFLLASGRGSATAPSVLCGGFTVRSGRQGDLWCICWRSGPSRRTRRTQRTALVDLCSEQK